MFVCVFVCFLPSRCVTVIVTNILFTQVREHTSLHRRPNVSILLPAHPHLCMPPTLTAACPPPTLAAACSHFTVACLRATIGAGAPKPPSSCPPPSCCGKGDHGKSLLLPAVHPHLACACPPSLLPAHRRLCMPTVTCACPLPSLLQAPHRPSLLPAHTLLLRVYVLQ